MGAPAHHWKLGLFVALVAAAVVAALIGLGDCMTHPHTVAFTTYFDESVGGLDPGNRVEFRGVPVGSVSDISIAPDDRRIAITYGVDVHDLPKMGIVRVRENGGERYRLPPDLRAQVGGNGLTGVRNVTLDIVDPEQNPPPELPFAAPPNYIPAAKSAVAKVTGMLSDAADQVPRVLGGLEKVSDHAERILAKLERDDVSGAALATLVRADDAVGALDTAIRRLDRERVPEKTSEAIGAVREVAAHAARVLGELDGERGLIANIGRTSEQFGQVGRTVSGSSRDIRQTLDELHDAADAIRKLAEDLDREPDILLKGRSQAQPR